MSKFDSIIGYAIVKKELRCLVDTLKNRDAYSKLGVKAPRGLLLHGVPGVGKSLMASAVIEESGLPADRLQRELRAFVDEHIDLPMPVLRAKAFEFLIELKVLVIFQFHLYSSQY